MFDGPRLKMIIRFIVFLNDVRKKFLVQKYMH